MAIENQNSATLENNFEEIRESMKEIIRELRKELQNSMNKAFKPIMEKLGDLRASSERTLNMISELKSTLPDHEEFEVKANESEGNDGLIVSEDGASEGFQTKIEGLNSPIHQACKQCVHDKVTSLPENVFSYLSLANNTVIGAFDTNKKESLVASKMLDEMHRRVLNSGYTEKEGSVYVIMNQYPPKYDDSGGRKVLITGYTQEEDCFCFEDTTRDIFDDFHTYGSIGSYMTIGRMVKGVGLEQDGYIITLNPRLHDEHSSKGDLSMHGFNIPPENVFHGAAMGNGKQRLHLEDKLVVEGWGNGADYELMRDTTSVELMNNGCNKDSAIGKSQQQSGCGDGSQALSSTLGQQGYNTSQQPSPYLSYPSQGPTQPGYGISPTFQTGYDNLQASRLVNLKIDGMRMIIFDPGGSHDLLEIRCSDNFFITHVVGLGKEVNPDGHENFKNDSSLYLQMLSVEETQCFALSMETRVNVKSDYVYFQFAVQYSNVYQTDISRVNGQLVVSRAVGDVPSKRYGVVPIPKVTDRRPQTANDSYLVAAFDNVFEKLSLQDVCDLLWKLYTHGLISSSCLYSLADCIVNTAFENGSTDNMATVVVSFRSTVFSKSLLKERGDEQGKFDSSALCLQKYIHEQPELEHSHLIIGKFDPILVEGEDNSFENFYLSENRAEDMSKLIDRKDHVFIMSNPKLKYPVLQLDLRLISELVAVIVSTTFGGFAFACAGQQVITRYLLVGSIIGPGGLSFVSEMVQVETVAQFDVIFLCALGLNFSAKRFRVVRVDAVLGGLFQIFLFICLSGITALLSGGQMSEGIFVGAFLSLSSTTVVLKFLMERNSINALYGQVTIVTLILQDCVVGLMFALLPIMGGSFGVLQGMMFMAKSLVILITFLAILSISCRTFVPWVLQPLISLSSQTNELYQLATVAFYLLVIWGSDKLGLRLELGSFVAAMMISTTDLAQHTLEQVEPIRNFSAALPLASIGMLIHVQFHWTHIRILLAAEVLVQWSNTLHSEATWEPWEQFRARFTHFQPCGQG